MTRALHFHAMSWHRIIDNHIQPSNMEGWPSGTILLLIYSFFPDSFVPQAHLSLLLGVWHWRQTCFHCWRSHCVVGNWCTKKSQYHTSKEILESELMTAIHWTKHTLLYFSTSCLIGAPLSWVRAWSYSSRHMQGYRWSPALEKSVQKTKIHDVLMHVQPCHQLSFTWHCAICLTC